MRNGHFRIWNRARNTEKHRKREMHTVGLGLWQENQKK